MTLATIVTMGGFTWESGKQLMDAEVILGSAEKSSSCKVTLSDPFHLIAAAVINHSLASGGIVALPGATAPSSTTNAAPKPGVPSGTTGTATTGSMAATGAEFTPSVKAFLDTVVKRETADATSNIAQSYYAKNGSGYFTDADIKAGGGFPLSQGRNQNIGRYQVNRGDWEDAQKYYKRKLGFSPVDQDLIGYWKLVYRNALKPLQAGDLGTAINKAGYEWASMPGSQYPKQIQAGTTLKEYTDYYQARLAFYGGKSAPVATVKPQTVVAPSKATTTPQTVKPAAPDASSTGTPVIKGSVITVGINGTYFDFYHQGTDMSSDGVTVLTGQGLRWSMSRRKRNRTLKDVRLSQVAALVAKAHKVTLDYKATIDPEYSHLDQSGISDYKFLLREVEENGLMMTEDKTSIVIMERKQMKPLGFVLARGYNLISYQIADRAMTGKEPAMTQFLPQESKTTIDPVTGKAKSTFKDVDGKGTGNTVTGSGKPATKGTVKGGDAQGLKEKAKTKRVGGLPSSFTVPLSAESLQSTPLSTAITEGFPEILNRIWVVQKLTHNVSNNTTQYELVSPVEVPDTEPVASIATGASGKTNVATGAGKWVYPVSGTVTSLQSPNRGGKPHNGCDIGAPNGTPIYAAGDGVVCTNQFQAGGAGNYIQIKHNNGTFTAYFHMEVPSPQPVGSGVKAGDKIGTVGNTGHSFGNHLHFELLTSVDPPKRLQVADTFTQLNKKGRVVAAGAPV